MSYHAHGRPVPPRQGNNSAVLRRVVATGQPANDEHRHATPAEAAQARLLEDLLRKEIAEMLNLPRHAQSEMRSRIAEVDRLIKALRQRFPRGPQPATRGVQQTANRAPRALLN